MEMEGLAHAQGDCGPVGVKQLRADLLGVKQGAARKTSRARANAWRKTVGTDALVKVH